MHIHGIFIGQPQRIVDSQGAWTSAIFRRRVIGPIQLTPSGLMGDRVADTDHHGRPTQAVCVHPLGHYEHWNAFYQLEAPNQLGPGSVGENWTLQDGDESSVYAGDVFQVGSARVRVSGPRMPCAKQERKLGLPGLLAQTIQTMRTGFYLEVLEPGWVKAGDGLVPQSRPADAVSLMEVNHCAYGRVAPAHLKRVLASSGVVEGWKELLRKRYRLEA